MPVLEALGRCPVLGLVLAWRSWAGPAADSGCWCPSRIRRVESERPARPSPIRGRAFLGARRGAAPPAPLAATIEAGGGSEAAGAASPPALRPRARHRLRRALATCAAQVVRNGVERRSSRPVAGGAARTWRLRESRGDAGGMPAVTLLGCSGRRRRASPQPFLKLVVADRAWPGLRAQELAFKLDTPLRPRAHEVSAGADLPSSAGGGSWTAGSDSAKASPERRPRPAPRGSRSWPPGHGAAPPRARAGAGGWRARLLDPCRAAARAPGRGGGAGVAARPHAVLLVLEVDPGSRIRNDGRCAGAPYNE